MLVQLVKVNLRSTSRATVLFEHPDGANVAPLAELQVAKAFHAIIHAHKAAGH